MINHVTPVTNRKLSIFYTNDLHGNIENVSGLSNASKYFDRVTQETGADVLKLSGGDNYAGADEKKNELALTLLRQVGIQVSAVGNHEFDAKNDSFAKTIKSNNIDFVATNMDIGDKNSLNNLIKKSIIKEVNGEKYGIIGATTSELDSKISSISSLGEDLEIDDFEGSVESLQEEIDKLHAQGVNKIILLSHSSYEVDKKLVQQLSGVDVVVGGHSHDLVKDVKNGENLLTGKDGKPVVIVQSGENGKNYGILNLEFDVDGVIKSVQNNIHPTNINQSPVTSYIKDATLGKSPVVGRISYVDPFPKNKRKEPCAWANFLADAVKDKMGVDIVFINSSNTRKVPLTGELTERDITETTPFKNKLYTLEMNEKEIIEGLKFASMSIAKPDGEPGLMKASGLSYKIDTNGNLLEVYFVKKDGTKEPLNITNPSENKKFTVCYDNFVAESGEYPPFLTKNKAVTKFDFDKDQCVFEYIRKMPEEQKQNLVIKDDGRLQIVQTSAPQLSNSSMQSFLSLTSPKNA